MSWRGVVLVLVLMSSAAGPLAARARVEGLLTAGMSNPLGIDEPSPAFSWRVTASGRGWQQSAYRVQVATSRDLLGAGKADMWDSGKVASAQSVGVRYAGKALRPRTVYYWSVQVWDRNSAAAGPGQGEFEMALMQPSDWSAKWIEANDGGGNGYHSQVGESVETVKWVQLDLGKTRQFNAVALYPARPYNWKQDVPGFGFPVRYRIEVSDEPEFKSPHVIADETGADQPRPGTQPVVLPVREQNARYVRVVATMLDSPEGRAPLFALAEVELLDGSYRNLARGAKVTAIDSIEEAGWSTSLLTDGERMSRAPSSAAPIMRREFALDKPVKRARAYVTGLGYYELWLNGKRVGDRVLDPPRTTHQKRLYYSVYDVTKLLKRGTNCAGAMLGQGWWWAGPMKLQCQIEIEFADGSKATIGSDPSWRSSPGPITSYWIYSGEAYDARREQPGWNKAGFDDSSWRPCVVGSMPDARLSVETIQPIKVIETLKPKSIKSPKPGVWVYDFGQNFAGWCRLKVAGKAAVSLRHAELLYPDGTINPETLTLATQTDTYILKGLGSETFEPRFTYHGFRYVQVEGFPGTPTLDSIEGQVVHTAFERRGTFACSNELLNRVYDACLWTQRDNFHSIPTDCPQRNERHGWLHDARVSSQAMLYSFDMARAYAKFLCDIQDIQGTDGRVTDNVPDVINMTPGAPLAPADPMWTTAYPLILWNTYLHTGDKTLLEAHYESIRRYVEMLRQEAGDACILTRNNYGDWIAVAETPKDLVSTGAYLMAVDALMRMAGELGKADDAATYGALRGRIADAFNAKFLDPGTSSYGNGSQLSNAMPLWFGIVPANRTEAVFANLVENIESRKGHLSTGIVGTPILMDVLVSQGRADLAYTVATQTDFPGWGYMLANGATTIWELWELKTGRGMNSHNHPALAFISGWYYEALAGIALDPAHPGWEHFIVKPHVVGDLMWARASVDTNRGKVASSWMLTDRGLALSVSVPANCTASVFVPKAGVHAVDISENGRPVWKSGRFVKVDGVVDAEDAGEWVRFEVGSGDYRWAVTPRGASAGR